MFKFFKTRDRRQENVSEADARPSGPGMDMATLLLGDPVLSGTGILGETRTRGNAPCENS